MLTKPCETEITQVFINKLCSCHDVDERLKMYESLTRVLLTCKTNNNNNNNNNNNKINSNSTNCCDTYTKVAFELLLRGVQDVWSRIRHVCIDSLITSIASSYKQNYPMESISETQTIAKVDELEIKHIKCYELGWETIQRVLHIWPRAKMWYAKEGLLQLANGIAKLMTENAKYCCVALLKLILFVLVFPSLAESQLPLREAASELLISTVSHSTLLLHFAIDVVTLRLEQMITTTITTTTDKYDNEFNAHTLESVKDNNMKEKVNSINNIHHIEGYLLAFTKLASLVETNYEDKTDKLTWNKDNLVEKYYHLLMRYASHPASSVRQYVATAFKRKSLFILSQSILELTYQQEQQQEEEEQEQCCLEKAHTLPFAWEGVETLLMALYEQVCCGLRKGASYAFPWHSFWKNVCHFKEEYKNKLENYTNGNNNKNNGKNSEEFNTNCISAIKRASHQNIELCEQITECIAKSYRTLICASVDKQFEISRMGRQLLPCFTQWCVRYASDEKHTTRTVIESNVSNVDSSSFLSCVKILLHSLLEMFNRKMSQRSKSEKLEIAFSLSELEEHMEWCAHCMCLVWWFVAIRCVKEQEHVASKNINNSNNVIEMMHVVCEWLEQTRHLASHDQRLLAPAYFIIFTYIIPVISKCINQSTICDDNDNDYDENNKINCINEECSYLQKVKDVHLLLLELTSKTDMWEVLLSSSSSSSTARSFLPVMIDYVYYATMLHLSLEHLVPCWLSWLAQHDSHTMLLAHEQCILLELLHETIQSTCINLLEVRDEFTQNGNTNKVNNSNSNSNNNSNNNCKAALVAPHEVKHMFSFAYRKEFVAPTMLDGGDDVQSGVAWIHSLYSTQQSTPVFTIDKILLNCIVHNVDITCNEYNNKDNEEINNFNNNSNNRWKKEENVIEDVLRVISTNLYCVASTEAEVLNQIRKLIITLASNKPIWLTHKVKLLQMIVTRLDAVVPEWNVQCVEYSENMENVPEEEKCKETNENNWDDWDDEDNNNENLTVSGVSMNNEMAKAKELLTCIIHLHFDEMHSYLALPNESKNGYNLLTTPDTSTKDENKLKSKLTALNNYVNEVFNKYTF